MDNKTKAYFQLHFIVILYGLTAILGDLISLSAYSLVWWRVLITSVSLLFFIDFGKKILEMDKSLVLKFMGIGVIVALHWLTFYGSIKYANASIALAAMATASFFTAILEPIITKKPFSKLEIILALLIIPPMLLIARDLDLSLLTGLGIGLFSAFLAALFSILNKKLINEADAYQISFLEMSSAFLFLSIFLPFAISNDMAIIPLATDWIYLIILSIFCTTFAYVIGIKVLNHISAFDTNLVINLEPVYGIILAIIILKEHKEMPLNFYWGMVLIMVIVLSHPFIKKRLNN